jgi:hypothetical protein
MACTGDLMRNMCYPYMKWIEIGMAVPKDIIDGFQPRFSPIEGFNHGITRPSELAGLYNIC